VKVGDAVVVKKDAHIALTVILGPVGLLKHGKKVEIPAAPRSLGTSTKTFGCCP
jgi:hypothetical protein